MSLSILGLFPLFGKQAWAAQMGQGTAVGEPDPVVNRVFANAFYDELIYWKDYCDTNSVRLMKAILSAAPHLRPFDFHILLISNESQGGWGPFKATVTALQARWGLDPYYGVYMPLKWNYHSVLEHKGVIYDLDLSASPKPVVAQEFTAHFLDHRDQLKVRKVHGNDGSIVNLNKMTFDRLKAKLAYTPLPFRESMGLK